MSRQISYGEADPPSRIVYYMISKWVTLTLVKDAVQR